MVIVKNLNFHVTLMFKGGNIDNKDIHIIPHQEYTAIKTSSINTQKTVK